jgi:hypothetical protein
MKYIIAGKNAATGKKGNDSSDLNVYFELGWEVVGSRLDAIKLLKTGEISNDDTTIVTVDDRQFMYSSIFKNVMSWDDFVRKPKDESDSIEDWTQIRQFSFLNLNGSFEFWENRDARFESNSRYSRYEQDYDEIVNGFTKNDLALADIGENEQYYVACLRFRDHSEVRSSPVEWWKSLLNRIIEKAGRKIFLVGHGAEVFANNDSMKYIEKLQDYVTLIQDVRCKAVVAQSTGTCGLAFSASKVPVHWIDHTDCSIHQQNNPVIGGVCAMFLKSPVYKYISSDMNEAGIETIISRIL